MSDYIERQRLKEAISEDCQHLSCFDESFFDMVMNDIDEIPAANVREDVQGEWEWFDQERGTPIDGWDREWGWRCSCCKDTLNDEYDDPDSPPKFNFCPNCGARMAGGEQP